MSTTDVLSFTSTTSGGISSVQSAFIYTENSASSYRASLFTMNEFGSFDGAMLTITATQELGGLSHIFNMEATPVYDTGSWTNASSPNVFVIPRSYDRYQVGVGFLCSSYGVAPTTRLVHRGTGNPDWAYGVGEFEFQKITSFTGSAGSYVAYTSQVQNVYTPTDTIGLVWYRSNTLYVLPGSENIFWIRGIRRA